MNSYAITKGGTIGKAHLNPPIACDVCRAEIGSVFYDAQIMMGIRLVWANTCPHCFSVKRGKLGIGFGQEYTLTG